MKICCSETEVGKYENIYVWKDLTLVMRVILFGDSHVARNWICIFGDWYPFICETKHRCLFFCLDLMKWDTFWTHISVIIHEIHSNNEPCSRRRKYLEYFSTASDGPWLIMWGEGLYTQRSRRSMMPIFVIAKKTRLTISKRREENNIDIDSIFNIFWAYQSVIKF